MSGENDMVKDYKTILGVKSSKQHDSNIQIITFQCQHGSITV